MDELRELYQEVILDHGKSPRNRRKLERATGCANGHNPLCGDRVKVYVDATGDKYEDLSFEGNGCAICMASASMMTEMLKGRPLAEGQAIFRSFHDLVAGPGPETGPGAERELEEKLGKLVVFGGVREYPMRVKCATLAWHTLQAALDQPTSDDETADNAVTTE